MPRIDIARTDMPLIVTGKTPVWTTADPVNDHQVFLTGKEMILCRNTNAGAAATVTVISAPDPQGRKGDITLFSIPANTSNNGYAVLGPFPVMGWEQPDGFLFIDVATADLQFAVIVLP
jgi:hypothetical protein